MMSDLAPFVANVVRDQTITDLMNENARLQALVDANRRDIEITGKDGITKFADGTLLHPWRNYISNSSLYTGGHHLWDLEVHIAGIGKVVSFREMAESDEWTFSWEGYSFCFAKDDPDEAVDPMLYIRFDVECASDAQLLVIRDVFDNPTEANIQAYKQMNWDSAACKAGFPFVKFDVFHSTAYAQTMIQAFRQRVPQP